MLGEVPWNFNVLTPDLLQDHLLGVRQLQAGYSLAVPDFGEFAVGYETLLPVSEAQLDPVIRRLAVVIIRLAFFTSTTSIGYLLWMASHVSLISAACLA